MPGYRDDALSRLQKLNDPTRTAGATDAPAVSDDVVQAAVRLAAATRDLRVFLDRCEERLTRLEKDAGKEVTGLVQRLDGRVDRLLADAYAVAVERWSNREGTLFLCGVVLGLLLGFGVPYVWHSQVLAQNTHDVLVEILENTKRAAEAANAAPSPKPARRGP